MADAAAAQAFYELQTRHQNNLKLLRQVRGKQQRARRDRAEADAVLAELGGPEPAYRAVGKCFLRAQSPELRAAMEAQRKAADVDQDKCARRGGRDGREGLGAASMWHSSRTRQGELG